MRFELLFNVCPRLTPISLSGPLGTTLGSMDQRKKGFRNWGKQQIALLKNSFLFDFLL